MKSNFDYDFFSSFACFLVEKVNAAEYSFCLQYLMRPNVIKDVENVIRKALSYERTNRQRKSYPSAPIDSPRVLYSSINPLENHSTNPAGLNNLGQVGKSGANDSSAQQELVVCSNLSFLLLIDSCIYKGIAEQRKFSTT